MQKIKLIKKTGLTYFLLHFLFSLNLMAQGTEHPHSSQTDTLIQIAKVTGHDLTWDFSTINLSSYLNTSDSDLVHGIDPSTIYSEGNLNSINDSIIGSTKERLYSEGGIQMLKHGNYIMKVEGSGTLKTSGMLYTNIKKIKLTECYFHTINNSNAVTFVNTYYLFFNSDTKELLFSVFNKKRNLNQFIGSEFNGIEYDKAKAFVENPEENPLRLVLSPNPAGAQTELSYTLINNASVTIEVSNQNHTVNKVVFNGNKNAGVNRIIIPLNSYTAGLYTIKVTVNGNIYATSLIVE